VNKNDLISTPLGASINNFYTSPLNPNEFRERPVKTFSNQSQIILVSTLDNFNVKSVNTIKYSGTVPNIQRTVVPPIPIRILQVPPGALQPGVNNRLDAAAGIISASLSPDGNKLWLTSMIKCDTSAAS